MVDRLSDKELQLKKMYGEYQELFSEQEIVLGDGNIYAPLLLIGEAPGKDEVRLSKPFVGMAGKNLNEFLELLEIKRESIYITNAIKYRLSKINPKTERIINRSAKKQDVEQNRMFLLREIQIIDPDIIVTLGNVPLRAITNEDIGIGAVHGTLQNKIIFNQTYNIYPLYHPASIIYNNSLKETYIADILKLKDIISEKSLMKKYF